MLRKLRTTRESGKGPHDERAAVATEARVPTRDDQSPSLAAFDAHVRHQMIACAAYCCAEKRGFAGGAESQLRDWLEAEAEIDRMLAETKTKL